MGSLLGLANGLRCRRMPVFTSSLNSSTEKPERKHLIVLPLSVSGSGEIQGNNLLKTGAQSSRSCLSDLTLLKNDNGFWYMLLELIAQNDITVLNSYIDLTKAWVHAYSSRDLWKVKKLVMWGEKLPLMDVGRSPKMLLPQALETCSRNVVLW